MFVNRQTNLQMKNRIADLLSYLYFCSDLFGVIIVDEEKQVQAHSAFLEVLKEILHDAGKTSRKMKVQLAYRICKRVGLGSSRGDVFIVAKAVGISFSFAKRIVHCVLDGGREEDLFERRRPKTAFNNSEWAQKLKDFAFQPENARSVPGYY